MIGMRVEWVAWCRGSDGKWCHRGPKLTGIIQAFGYRQPENDDDAGDFRLAIVADDGTTHEAPWKDCRVLPKEMISEFESDSDAHRIAVLEEEISALERDNGEAARELIACRAAADMPEAGAKVEGTAAGVAARISELKERAGPEPAKCEHDWQPEFEGAPNYVCAKCGVESPF
jgi:hypothetical protein